METILSQSALSLAASIKSGALSCREVTSFFLDRIERFNPELSAFVEVWRHRAMFAALRRDLQLQSSRDVSPLFGVPLAIKDLYLVRFSRTRFGSRAMPFVWTPIDDRMVRALRTSDPVFVGKLSTSELGVMPVVEPDIHPPTRNPWDISRSSGGSSGGSSAAVASGMLPLVQASDGAGSIRIPAASCGLFGLKPSRHVVPSSFWDPDDKIMHTSGPLARGVEDAAALLDAMSAVNSGRYLRAARDPRLGQLKVGLCVKNPVTEIAPQYAAAAERVAKLLEARGCTVVEVPPPDGSVEEFLPLYGHMFHKLPLMDWSRAQGISQWVREHGRGLTTATARDLQDRLMKKFLQTGADVDLVITPTTPKPPPLVGELHRLSPQEAFLGAAVYGAFTAIFNVTGQPAASVPVLDMSPMPIGVQLVAKEGEDELILSAARLIEQDLGGPAPIAPNYRNA